MPKIISSNIINDGETSPTESTLLHPYPGSMPAFLASGLIEQYSKKGDTVFDPFCGSGSVLTEGLRLKRNCIGSDLLDLSVSIAKIAVNMPERESIFEEWERVRESALCDCSLFADIKNKKEKGVNIEKLSQWFHPETFTGVLSIRSKVDIGSNNTNKAIIALILAGSLTSLSKRVSRGVLHWGWIADNVIPKPDDLYIVNPFEEVDRRIRKLGNFIAAAGGGGLSKGLYCDIKRINWLDYKGEFNNKKIDLLITSPPYPYSIDYTLAQRLTFYFFDKDINEVRESEIGARYKRKRKQRTKEYLNDLKISLNNCSQHVKIGGKAVFVLPHPGEYTNVIDFTEFEWMEFINSNLTGTWKLLEYGIRDCAQRRIVNANVTVRRELIMVSSREG